MLRKGRWAKSRQEPLNNSPPPRLTGKLPVVVRERLLLVLFEFVVSSPSRFPFAALGASLSLSKQWFPLRGGRKSPGEG